MVDPEISVVMPAYKGASFIGAALESVMAQTFADWELVCVDDGSRDGSGDIAAEYAARDGRIRVLRQANGGTSAARNAGIEAARGRYIAFLDEDDIYHPKCLEVLHAAAVRHGADAVGIDFVPFEEGASLVISPTAQRPNKESITVRKMSNGVLIPKIILTKPSKTHQVSEFRELSDISPSP